MTTSNVQYQNCQINLTFIRVARLLEQNYISQAKAEKEFKQAKKAFKAGKSQTEKANLEKKRKALERAMEQLDKLNTQVRESIEIG